MDGQGKHIRILHNLRIFLCLHEGSLIRLYMVPLPQLCRTVLGARSATGSISINDAIFLDKNNISHLCKMFLLYTYGKNCSIGQTSPQTVQSKLQNPFSKLTVGCIIPAKPYSIKAGCRTWEGHLLTQRWQDVHCCWKCSRLIDPGGVIGFSFLYAFLTFQSSNGFFGLGQEFGCSPGSNKTGNQKAAFGWIRVRWWWHRGFYVCLLFL